MHPIPASCPRLRERPGLIPLSAAGRQPLFFFGTLMDIDVLAHVLARPIDGSDLEAAAVAGFRRVRARAASYPVLLPDADGHVDGRLLRRASCRDIARINHYESGEYRAELRRVTSADGEVQMAWLYVALNTLTASDEPWQLDLWQRMHKPGFLTACADWLADFPEIGPAAGEAC